MLAAGAREAGQGLCAQRQGYVERPVVGVIFSSPGRGAHFSENLRSHPSTSSSRSGFSSPEGSGRGLRRSPALQSVPLVGAQHARSAGARVGIERLVGGHDDEIAAGSPPRPPGSGSRCPRPVRVAAPGGRRAPRTCEGKSARSGPSVEHEDGPGSSHAAHRGDPARHLVAAVVALRGTSPRTQEVVAVDDIRHDEASVGVGSRTCQRAEHPW